jgi:general secretion pathway protein I
MSRPRVRTQAGFTLLEVLVAFAILAVAVVSLIQLASQGLRLLKLSGDHQQALLLADRIARETQVSPDDAKTDSVDSGEEGNFAWERRITRLPLPEEFEPKTTLGKELPGLYTVSVAVRWGRNQTVEVATLRAPVESAPATPATQAPSAAGNQPLVPIPGAQPSAGGTAAGPFGAGMRPFTR